MYTRDSELAAPLKGGGSAAAPALSRTMRLATVSTVGMLAAFCAGMLFASSGGVPELPALGVKRAQPAPEPVASGKRFRTNLAFHDDFDFLDFSKWRHEITMGGGGNW